MITTKNFRIIFRYTIYLFTLAFFSCGEKFLDVKPTQNQRVPNRIEDYLGIMDNTDVMNQSSSHYIGVIGSDEISLTETQFNTFPEGIIYNHQKNAYVWNAVVYEGQETDVVDWTNGYQRILRSNIVLDGLKKIAPKTGERKLWDEVKGTALFHRALNYYQLAQLYCNVYQANSAATDLGLPLRVTADVTDLVPRSSLQHTYGQIVQDLQEAKLLLPNMPETPFRPSKWAVHALLAQVYLQMEDYVAAVDESSECLALNDGLIDFNTLDADLSYPFPAYGQGNDEVIFVTALGYGISYRMTRSFYNAPLQLLSSYEPADLRKLLYFSTTNDGLTAFRGSYLGLEYHYFTGLAVDEIFLTRAEALARLGMIEEALLDLNRLREHRFLANQFQRLYSDDQQEVLDWIIADRRKELVMRGRRWEDLRRLNKEPRYANVLTRKIGGTYYELPPGDKRWTWPLPIEAVLLGGYRQNDR